MSLSLTDRYTSRMTACFDGTHLSVLRSYDPGEWNWYILERELNNGTECSFVTTLRNNLLDSTPRLDTSTCTMEGIIQPDFLYE